jgi:hypothetical protein
MGAELGHIPHEKVVEEATKFIEEKGKYIMQNKSLFQKASMYKEAFIKMPNALSARLAEGGLGALVGGGAGYATGDSNNKLQSTLMGAGMGAGTASLGSSSLRNMKKLQGMKPLAQDIPEVFYHGHPEHLKDVIKKEGLRPAKRMSSHRSEGALGAKYRGDHVFLSKDESYAKSYGKFDPQGYFDWNKDPTVTSVVLPKERVDSLQNVMARPGTPDLAPRGMDLAGVGRMSVDGRPVGFGSEFAHKGPIAPEHLAYGKEETDKLISKMIADAANQRVQGIDEHLFGLGKKAASIKKAFIKMPNAITARLAEGALG